MGGWVFAQCMSQQQVTAMAGLRPCPSWMVTCECWGHSQALELWPSPLACSLLPGDFSVATEGTFGKCRLRSARGVWRLSVLGSVHVRVDWPAAGCLEPQTPPCRAGSRAALGCAVGEQSPRAACELLLSPPLPMAPAWFCSWAFRASSRGRSNSKITFFFFFLWY